MKQIRKNESGNFQVYKVLVTDKNGDLRSAMYPLRNGYFDDLSEGQKAALRRHSLTYFTDWTVWSRYGKILTFRTLKSAKSFVVRCRNMLSAEVWEAEAQHAKVPETGMLPYPWDLLSNIKRFWKNGSVDGAGGTWGREIEVPYDTLFCDGVRLVRKRNR